MPQPQTSKGYPPMANQQNPNPSFPVCKLYEKTSKAGNAYFVGRWGGAKVTVLKSRETADDGGAIWNVMLSEAAPYQPRGNGTASNLSAQPDAETVRETTRGPPQ